MRLTLIVCFRKATNSPKKVIASAVVSWNGVTNPIFVGKSNLKSNSRPYLEHLRNDLIPVMKVYLNNNFIFIQDSAPSNRAKIGQIFLREELKSIFVASMEGPPSFPDCYPLEYYFWKEVKEKVYSGHHAKPTESEK